VYWERSSAINLVELLRSQNRDAEAHAALGPIYDRFTEGFSAKSLIRAKGILVETPSDGRNSRRQ
jgi:non-specific serine/threonine protein kinase